MTFLRRAVYAWWVTSAIAGLAVSSPLLPWFEVLRQVPVGSFGDDVGILFDRVFTGASVAQTVSPGALLEATVWQLVLWRLVLFVPMTAAMSAVTRPRMAPLKRGDRWRALLQAWARIPAFVGVSLVLQTVAVLGTGFGLTWATSRLTAPDLGALDASLGAVALVASLAFCLVCLTVLESARLSLFQRKSSSPTDSALSSVLDGVEALRRHGWRLLLKVEGWGTAAIAASGVLCAAGSFAAVVWPSGFGSIAAWAFSQAGVGLAIACRVAGWQASWLLINRRD